MKESSIVQRLFTRMEKLAVVASFHADSSMRESAGSDALKLYETIHDSIYPQVDGHNRIRPAFPSLVLLRDSGASSAIRSCARDYHFLGVNVLNPGKRFEQQYNDGDFDSPRICKIGSERLTRIVSAAREVVSPAERRRARHLLEQRANKLVIDLGLSDTGSKASPFRKCQTAHRIVSGSKLLLK